MSDTEETIAQVEETIQQADDGLTTLTKGEIAWLKNWIAQSKQNPQAQTDEATIQKIETLTLTAQPVEDPIEPEPEPEPEPTTRRSRRVRRLTLPFQRSR